MKSVLNVPESASEYRLWWRKEGFSLDADILVRHLNVTLYEAGLARITGKVLYK